MRTREQRMIGVWLLACLALWPVAASSAPASAGVVSGAPLSEGGVAASDPVPASVQVTPRFRPDERFRLRIEKSAQVEAVGQVFSRQGTTGEIEVHVLAHDAAGSRLVCRFGAVTAHEDTDPAIRDNPLQRLMLASREGMTMRFVTGPRFSNPRIENADEVVAAFRQTLASATALMPAEVAAAVTRLLEPLLANPQALATKLAEDLYVYFMVIGTDVPLRGALSSHRAAPPLVPGGEPVKTWSTLRIERYDREANRLRLQYRQTANPRDVASAADNLAETARAAAREQGAQDESASDGEAAVDAQAGDAQAVDARDSATYEVDLSSGWPDRVERLRSTRNGQQRLVEHTSIRRLP